MKRGKMKKGVDVEYQMICEKMNWSLRSLGVALLSERKILEVFLKQMETLSMSSSSEVPTI